jgi:hypothetical protein
MIGDGSILGEQPDVQYTPEQLAAIRSLDASSTTASKPAISKPILLTTIAAGVFVSCLIYKFINPELAWSITSAPGFLAVVYVNIRSLLGRPLTNKRSWIVYAFLMGMLLASSLWRLISLIFNHLNL